MNPLTEPLALGLTPLGEITYVLISNRKGYNEGGGLPIAALPCNFPQSLFFLSTPSSPSISLLVRPLTDEFICRKQSADGGIGMLRDDRQASSLLSLSSNGAGEWGRMSNMMHLEPHRHSLPTFIQGPKNKRVHPPLGWRNRIRHANLTCIRCQELLLRCLGEWGS